METAYRSRSKNVKFKKEREILLQCKNCKKKFHVLVNNIYKADINEVVNCPSCGATKPNILEIKLPKNIQHAK